VAEIRYPDALSFYIAIKNAQEFFGDLDGKEIILFGDNGHGDCVIHVQIVMDQDVAKADNLGQFVVLILCEFPKPLQFVNGLPAP
jgi:hypothetical protein